MSTHPKRAPHNKPRRPYRLPTGITRDQARAAGIVLCSGAVDRAEATMFLQIAGLIRDPEVMREYLGGSGINPMVVKPSF